MCFSNDNKKNCSSLVDLARATQWLFHDDTLNDNPSLSEAKQNTWSLLKAFAYQLAQHSETVLTILEANINLAKDFCYPAEHQQWLAVCLKRTPKSKKRKYAKDKKQGKNVWQTMVLESESKHDWRDVFIFKHARISGDIKRSWFAKAWRVKLS